VFAVLDSWYWSITPYEDRPEAGAWSAHGGGGTLVFNKSNPFRVRAVRTAQ
jgi:hypothetical protein